MANADVREKAKTEGVYIYQISHEIGVSEPTVIRWLRYELPGDKKLKVLAAIDTIAASRNGGENV